MMECDVNAATQQWTIRPAGAWGSLLVSSNNQCLSASTSDDAVVSLAECPQVNVPNEVIWQLPGSASGSQIINRLKSYCLSVPSVDPSTWSITATLHESTLSRVYIDGVYVGEMNNEVHNGYDSSFSLSMKRPFAGNHIIEFFSITLGISADLADLMPLPEERAIQLLGLGSVSMGKKVLSGWMNQAGLLGESLRVFDDNAKFGLPWTVIDTPNVAGLTWLRATFDAPSDWVLSEALAVDLTGAGQGHIYLNGFDAGRYWLRDPVTHLTAYYQLPPDNLKPSGRSSFKP